jgi:hypothetical protein
VCHFNKTITCIRLDIFDETTPPCPAAEEGDEEEVALGRVRLPTTTEEEVDERFSEMERLI